MSGVLLDATGTEHPTLTHRRMQPSVIYGPTGGIFAIVKTFVGAPPVTLNADNRETTEPGC